MSKGLLILSKPTLKKKALPFSRYYTTRSRGQCWCTHGLWTSYWCQKGRRGWEGYRHLPVNNICLEDGWPQQKERNLPCNVWTGSCCMCIGLKLSLSYQPERNEPWRPTLSAAEGICGWIWRWRWHCDSQHHRGSSPIWKSHLRKKPVPLAKVMETAGCRLVHLIAVIIPVHCHCPVTTRPILAFKHFLYLCRKFGFRNSQF